ncbi:hypothetical protein HpKG65_15190 [Helicobacter pylori]
MITSFERDEKVLRELETNGTLSNDYKGNSNYSALNLNENNSTKETSNKSRGFIKNTRKPAKNARFKPTRTS